MMKLYKTWNWPRFVAVVALIFIMMPHVSFALRTPIQSLQTTHKKITKLLKVKTTAGSPKEKKVKDEIKDVINALLDYEELGKQSLGKHWEKRTPAEQKQFVNILKQLIEINYTKQLKDNIGYVIEYRGEKIENEKALVTTAIKVKKNKRTTEILIQYWMKKSSDAWTVYDVITDEVSLIKNYRSQFNRIIKRDSFAA